MTSGHLYGHSWTLDVIREDRENAILSYANVLFSIWRDAPSADRCASLYDVAVDLARKSGVGKVAALSMIGPAARAPSPAAREALSRLREDPQKVVYRSALVVPKIGFIGAIVRSIALGVQGAARRGGHRPFEQVDDALVWITDGLPTPGGARIPVRSMVIALGKHVELEGAQPQQVP